MGMKPSKKKRSAACKKIYRWVALSKLWCKKEVCPDCGFFRMINATVDQEVHRLLNHVVAGFLVNKKLLVIVAQVGIARPELV